MKYKAITMLGLAGVLLAWAAPGLAQSVNRATPDLVPLVPQVLNAERANPAGKTAADTTLRYYDLFVPGNNGPFALSLERDGADTDIPAVGTVLTAPFDGTIDRVDFALFNGSGFPGVAGTGTLRIKLVENAFALTNQPLPPGIDSLDVDITSLATGASISPGNLNNQIDVSNRNFEIEEGEDYFLQLTLLDNSNDAALTFLFDGGSNDTLDTRFFPPRTFVYVDSLAANVIDGDDLFSLRDDNDTTFTGLNLLLELQLTKTPPPPPPPPSAVALMQFVHNVPGAGMVDIYIKDSLVVDDLGFREATRFLVVPAGEQTLDVVDGSAADNSSPLFSSTDTILQNRPHWAVAAGGQTPALFVDEMPGEEGEEGKLSYVIAHGADGADAIDLNIIDETPLHAFVRSIVNGLDFGQFVGPVSLTAGTFNVELATDGTQVDVFRVTVPDGSSGDGGTMLLLSSGTVGASDLALLTIDAQGTVDMPPVSTATEALAVPERFALHGNFPNPFNPTTTIRFDLGTPGFTTLTVYNLLGQEVATLVAEPLTAGAYEMAFDASRLPSGPYLYRLTSGSFSEQRMLLLIK